MSVSATLDFNVLQVPRTPALVLLRAALERNLDLMQRRCNAAGVALRAHGKMHKCSTIAKLQMAKGAVGICAQTVGEAEAFVGSGIQNVLVTSPAPLAATPRAAELARRAKLAAVVDDAVLVAAFAAAARTAGIVLDLLVDIDLGQHRTGVRPGEVVALAQRIATTNGVRFAGIQGYVGHLQHVAARSARNAANETAIAALERVSADLRAANLRADTVTGGGTGTHFSDLASGVFTEIQAGSYAVMDAQYGACEAPDGDQWAFVPALALAATVVSARHRTHVTVDAGSKAFSMDGPAARVIAGAANGSIWRSMGDEHGAILHPEYANSLSAVWNDAIALEAAIDTADAQPGQSSAASRLGDTVWLQPGHCDPTINLYDAFLVVETDGSWSRWPIDARRTTARLDQFE
ncbi:MAG: alanine racemase [Steroidobacteraceae bacterium]|jgi:D-serine deaminase-like pyridoxal phosphate-dependent protein